MRELVRFTAPLAGLCAVALLGACAEPSVGEQEPSVGEAISAISLPPPPPGAVCITLERGVTGNVSDADLSVGNGSWAAGAYSGLWTGGTTSPHWLVAKTDLSPIPPQSVIASATFSVYAGWNASSSEVRAHRVTANWAEATVSWPNFGGTASWDPATLSSFNPTGVGYKSLDITALAQDWYSGAASNFGVLLEENPGVTHSFFASESSNAGLRPRFDVCYFPGPCAGKEDGTSCDDKNPCTQTDTCTAGICNGTNEIDCNGTDCNPSTGQCAPNCPCRALPGWHPLDQESTCLYTAPGSGSSGVHLTGDGGVEIYAEGQDGGLGTCSTAAGSFTDLTPDELSTCIGDLLEFDGTPGAGAPALLCACQVQADGAACNDGNPCTLSDTCQSGACGAGTPTSCDIGTACDPQSGECVPADPCASNPCQNGGTCTSDEGIYSCACQPGYDGPECQIQADPCSPDPCNGNGICQPIDPFTYSCGCAPGWTGSPNCDVPTCPCTTMDIYWSAALSTPGVEVIPSSLQTLFAACDESGGTADFTDYRAFLPDVDATMLADFQTSVAALDTNAPDWCATVHDLYFGLVTNSGYVSAGTVTSTSGGVTTTTTVCVSSHPGQVGAFYDTTPAQNALCVGEIDAAGGGSVTTM